MTDNAAARRASVLAYPDLADRLCQPPLNYQRPEQWNGYVPPFLSDAGDTEHLHSPHGYGNQRGKRTKGREENDSPRRAALVEIAAEAWRRDHAEDRPS